MAPAGQPVPDEGPRRPGREGHPLLRRRPPRPARRLPARPTGEVRNAPVLLQVHGGGWTIGNKDQQGIPLMQHMAAQGLGVRGDQLPARPARPVPGARHRREAGDRLDPRAHRGVRRQPRLHRHHRRLGRRPPRRAGGAHRQRPGVPAGLRGRRHLGPGGDPALRRLRLRRLDRPAQRRAAPRRVPGAAHPAEALGRLTRRLRGRLAHPADHRRRARLLRAARQARHAGPGRPGPAVRRPRCARPRSAPSCTPSSPAPSTRSTCSRRSAPPTSSARSTATCTGTGTAGATPTRASSRPLGLDRRPADHAARSRDSPCSP